MGKARPEKYAAIQRDSDAISGETRGWLHDLPREWEQTLAGTEVVLTHYAPGVKEGIGPWTPDAHLEELARGTGAHVVVCGHTHTPFARRVGGVLWVNPGTAGRDWGRRAPYAVLTLAPDTAPQVQLCQAHIA